MTGTDPFNDANAEDLRELVVRQQRSLQEMAATVEKLAAGRSSRRRRGLRGAAAGLTLTLVATVAAMVGAANADSSQGGSTHDVRPIGITAKKLLNAVTVAKGTTKSVVVSGGTTTVPSNATVVQLEVTLKGTKAGGLLINPTGWPTNNACCYNASTTMLLDAPGTVAQTVLVNIGLSNQVSFVNQNSTTPVTVTASVTGYSSQVAGLSISGVGGPDGSVLVNQGGAIADWERLDVGSIGGAGGDVGEVFVNNGATSKWANVGHAYTSRSGRTPISSGGFNQVATLTAPVGLFQVTATLDVFETATQTDGVVCRLLLPGGGEADTEYQSVSKPGIVDATMTLQGVMRLDPPAGDIAVVCQSQTGSGTEIYSTRIIATSLAAIN